LPQIDHQGLTISWPLCAGGHRILEVQTENAGLHQRRLGTRLPASGEWAKLRRTPGRYLVGSIPAGAAIHMTMTRQKKLTPCEPVSVFAFTAGLCLEKAHVEIGGGLG